MANAITLGRNEVVWWLHENIPNADFSLQAALSAAVRKGDIVMAEWLLDHNVNYRWRQNLTHGAAAQGRTDIVKWLSSGADIKDGTLVVAAWRGHSRLVRWLMNSVTKKVFEQNESTIEGLHLEAQFAVHAAAINGHLELAKYLRERTIKMSTRTSNTAAGDANVFRRVCAELSPPYEAAIVSAKTMVEAAKNGHIDVVKWLYNEYRDDPEIDIFKITSAGCGSANITAMDAAARNGHMNVLKYLHELQLSLSKSANKRKRDVLYKLSIPTCTEEAMDGAAANGHLTVLQWLHIHRSGGCTKLALDGAATQGHLHVARWLFENRSEGCSCAAIDGAAANGHLLLVQWLHNKAKAECTTKAIDVAAQNGHLDVVKWINTNRSEGCTSDAQLDGDI